MTGDLPGIDDSPVKTQDVLELAGRLKGGTWSVRDLHRAATWLPWLCGEREGLAARLRSLGAEGGGRGD